MALFFKYYRFWVNIVDIGLFCDVGHAGEIDEAIAFIGVVIRLLDDKVSDGIDIDAQFSVHGHHTPI